MSAGDRGWEGEGWRVTEAMGSRVPGSRSLAAPNWFFVLWGCCVEGLFQRLFLVGPGGWGRLVTGLVQGPRGPRRLGEAGHGAGSRPPQVPER